MAHTKQLEKRSKSRARKENVQKAILAAVIIAGVLPFALLGPQSLVFLKKVGLFPETQSKRSSIARARRQLIARGHIRVHDGFLEITPQGKEELERLSLQNYQVKKPRRWDGKWRVLIFDIPEARKSTRDRIRHSLLEVGFKKIQDSVWLYPYDCEEFVALLKAELRVGKDLLYMIVDALEGDHKHRAFFGLPIE